MGKFLLLIVLGGVVWWMWRKLQSSSSDQTGHPTERPAEIMVSCALCGLNQPRSECVESEGALYCSEAHRQQAERRGEDG